MRFTFRGEISSSKSIYNRALIIQSFSEHVQIRGITQSDDVVYLQNALRAFKAGETSFFCGDGGTTFRFLAVRVSRQPGNYQLRGTEQLFRRPMKELFNFFDQMGVTYSLNGTSLSIASEGWAARREIQCTSTQSSQFLSSIALSSWGLAEDLRITMPRQLPSRGYLDMTLRVIEDCGGKGRVQEASSTADPVLVVKATQKPMATTLVIEQDMSSLFALAACAIVDGEIEIKNLPVQSIQPDSIFFDFFRRMKIQYERTGKMFYIKKQDNYRGLDVDISNSPDLFPVLAVLCARAQDFSTITGLDNLQFKESDRLENVLDLLRRIGRRVDVVENGVMIHGRTSAFSGSGNFDPKGDHRMAMAAELANLGGAQLNITDKSVTNKSFPEFWEIVEGQML